ncbi:MAG: hypothetical protein AAFX04_09115 [Pseudomonadota bacterium]
MYHYKDLKDQAEHDNKTSEAKDVKMGTGGCSLCGCGGFSPYGENDEYCYCGHHYNDHY